MKTTCLINNFNYQRYVGDAIESLLDQTVLPEKIIVVDDGSTDDSVEYLKGRYGGCTNVVIVEKDHGGQLSCFNRGIQEVSSELVFFLDADDQYQPNYLETAIAEYESRPEIDFLTVASRVCPHRQKHPARQQLVTRDLGISVVGMLLGSHWVGEKTSCISMRTSVARQILPFPYESDWKIRADDVLVFGSSAIGAYKRHLGLPLVNYRVHSRNNFANANYHVTQKLRRSLAINRLCNWFVSQMGYELSLLPTCLHREFRTRQKPTLKEWLAYQKLACSNSLSVAAICKHFAVTGWHFARENFQPASEIAALKQPLIVSRLPEPTIEINLPITDAA